MEIFVRPMRDKGSHQAHNAQVVICAFFTTPNSLKSQEWRKAFSPIRKVRAISQKLYSHTQRQIPIASDARPPHTSRGFLGLFLSRSSQSGNSVVFRQFPLFDLKARFFVPTRGSLTSSRAGAVKVGRPRQPCGMLRAYPGHTLTASSTTAGWVRSG